MKDKKGILALGAGLIAFIIVVIVALGIINNSNIESNNGQANETSMLNDNPENQVLSQDTEVIVISDPVREGEELNLKTYSTPISEQQLALDFLNNLESESEFSFETESSSFGEFITSVNGIETDQTTEYWRLELNGEDAPVGISELMVSPGDELGLILTKL